MSKPILVFLLCAAYAGALNAQPVMNAADFPRDAGTNVLMQNTAGLVPVDLGASGPDQTWRFSSMATTTPWVGQWLNPASTPYGGEFPSANRCLLVEGDGEVYGYFTLTQSSYSMLGGVADTSGGLVTLHVNNPLPLEVYPISYGSQWWSVWDTDLGLGITVQDCTLHRVDAWGTVTDITGTFSCLRVQSHRKDVVYFLGFPYQTQTGWTYSWLVPGRGELIAIASDTNEVNPNFTEGRFTRQISITPPTHPRIGVTLAPSGAPIVIPAGGGTFRFNITIRNNEPTQQTFDVWCMLVPPEGSWLGPVLGPVELTRPGGASISRDRQQSIPGSYSAGNYRYEAYVGDYPNVVYDYDAFGFEKLAVGDGAWVDELQNWGDDWEAEATAVGAIHGAKPPCGESPLQCNISPNPFNPMTAISYQLSAFSYVSLKVYDTAGRLVETLVDGWREAGVHEVVFDAASLPSGVYFAQIAAENHATLQKLVLLK